MPPPPNFEQLPPLLRSYCVGAQSRMGLPERRRLGVVDELLIRRYAVAIGDWNPLYHEAAAARRAGYRGLLAPPNLLAAIVDWGCGAPESELAPDGTPSGHSGVGLRLMGAGEEMQYSEPLVADATIFDTEEIVDITVKSGKSGPLVFVSTSHRFENEIGEIYCRNIRTILVRE